MNSETKAAHLYVLLDAMARTGESVTQLIGTVPEEAKANVIKSELGKLSTATLHGIRAHLDKLFQERSVPTQGELARLEWFREARDVRGADSKERLARALPHVSPDKMWIHRAAPVDQFVEFPCNSFYCPMADGLLPYHEYDGMVFVNVFDERVRHCRDCHESKLGLAKDLAAIPAKYVAAFENWLSSSNSKRAQ